MTIIKSNWKNYKIKDISIAVSAGATPSTKRPEYWENGTIPWMSSGEVNNEIINTTDKLITRLGFDNSSTKIIPKNSVLIALAGQGKTRGKVAINKIELCTNQSLASIIPNDKVHYKYLYYNLQYRYLELRELSSGDGGRGGLNLRLINNIKISLPPVNEQEKIADILSTWDDKINRLIKLIDVQENYREAIVKLLITKYHNQKLIKKEYKHLKYYLNSKNEKVLDRDIEPVAVGVNGIRLRSEIYDKELSDDYSNNKVIRQNDLCFGIGTNNIVYDVLLEDKVYCVSPAYKVYEIDKIDAFYLKSYLDTFNEYYSKKYMIISSRQGKSVDMKGLLNEKIYAPSYEEQLKFSKVIHTIDEYINLLNEELEVVKLQKQGLMQQLLTGKIRVNLN